MWYAIAPSEKMSSVSPTLLSPVVASGAMYAVLPSSTSRSTCDVADTAKDAFEVELLSDL